MTILSAKVAQVEFGNLATVEGLLLENGEYAIAVQQVAAMFSVASLTVHRLLKRLQGKDSSRITTYRVKTDRTNSSGRKVRTSEIAISISDFRKIVRGLDKKEHPLAVFLVDVLTDVALLQLFADGFSQELTASDRQVYINRLLEEILPWIRLYDKDLCTRGFRGYGARFYYKYFYFWLTAEEKAHLEKKNPVVNGKRKDRIYNWIEPKTRGRLKDKAIELAELVRESKNKVQFEQNFRNKYGQGWQLELF